MTEDELKRLEFQKKLEQMDKPMDGPSFDPFDVLLAGRAIASGGLKAISGMAANEARGQAQQKAREIALNRMKNQNVDLNPQRELTPVQEGKSFLEQARETAVAQGKDLGKTMAERRNEAYGDMEKKQKALEFLKSQYDAETLKSWGGKKLQDSIEYLKNFY